MKIRCRRLRHEGVQPEKIELLRVQRERCRSCLLRCDDEIELCVRVETLEFRIPLERWKAVHRCSDKAVLKGLRDGDAPFHERTGERHPRRCRADASDGAVAVAQPGNDVLDRKMYLFIVTRLRRNGRNCPGELPYWGSYGFEMTCTAETTSIG